MSRERSSSFAEERRDVSRGEGSSSRGPDDDPIKGQRSLLVRNLSFQTSGDEIRELMEKYGQVRDVYLPLDYYSKRPRGFAFVEFLDANSARDAQEQLDRYDWHGRDLAVVFAKESRKTPKEMNPRMDRRGGGGYRDRSRDRYDDRRGGGDRYDDRRSYGRDRYNDRDRGYDRDRRDDYGRSRGGGGYDRDRSPPRNSRRYSRSRSPRSNDRRRSPSPRGGSRDESESGSRSRSRSQNRRRRSSSSQRSA